MCHEISLNAKGPVVLKLPPRIGASRKSFRTFYFLCSFLIPKISKGQITLRQFPWHQLRFRFSGSNTKVINPSLQYNKNRKPLKCKITLKEAKNNNGTVERNELFYCCPGQLHSHQ